MKLTNQRSSRFAPPFKDIHSRLYEAEYAAASIAIVYYMGWRGERRGDEGCAQ